MGAEDVEIATRFLRAAGASLKTGDREPVYPLLAQDVEWVTPMRTLRGVDEVRNELIWGFPPEKLDADVELGELEDLGEGGSGATFARCTAGSRPASSPTNAGGGSR
jgi:hypothetical protein